MKAPSLSPDEADPSAEDSLSDKNHPRGDLLPRASDDYLGYYLSPWYPAR